jgi:hypothetical protein
MLGRILVTSHKFYLVVVAVTILLLYGIVEVSCIYHITIWVLCKSLAICCIRERLDESEESLLPSMIITNPP